jgi:hypothetical protein
MCASTIKQNNNVSLLIATLNPIYGICITISWCIQEKSILFNFVTLAIIP